MRRDVISSKDQYKPSDLYLIAKDFSTEILLEEFIQSRGAYYSAVSENFVKSKNQMKKKVILTKLFYAVMFGILPIIPVFGYFEYIRLLTSGGLNFEVIIFSISLLYAMFFSLQFFNFLLMAILETSVILSGKATEWLKTLPISEKNLKQIIYYTIFRNFDIPIIVIVLSFPIAMLIGTGNLIIFLVSFGISLLNTLLALDLIILISGRLNRVLNINDVSSKKTFFIRIFNTFTYVFLIIGSIYFVQWASTSIEGFFELFSSSESPGVINVLLSTIPYPLSQCYLLGLLFSPITSNYPLWIGTLAGTSLLILISYVTYKGAMKAIQKSFTSEPVFKHKEAYIEDMRTKVEIKTNSSFIAFFKKDLISATRDIKVFLSFIMPIIVSFIFVIYLNLQNIDPTEPAVFQIFRTWLGCLLISPIISSILVYSLLNLESTGQTILESLPILPREQAKAKILLMFLILNLSILSPSLLFVTSSRFIVYLLGIVLCLPFAWIFLLFTFELRIYFFAKRFNSYIVGDLVLGNSFFKMIIIFLVPLGICVWIISIATLLTVFPESFIINFTWFIIIVLVSGFIFTILFFDKLFPLPKIKEDTTTSKISVRKVKNPTYFTEHIWISIIVILILQIVFYMLLYIVGQYILQLFEILYNLTSSLVIINNILLFIYYVLPVLIMSIFYTVLYFIILPKVLGIPYGRKRVHEFFDDIGCSWLRYILKYSRYIIIGVIFSIILTSISNWFITPTQTYYLYINALVNNIVNVLWFEIIFRGIFLSLLSKRYKNFLAIVLHVVLIIMVSYILPIYGNIFYRTPLFLWNFNFEFFAIISIEIIYNLVLGYIVIKTKSLTPAIVINLITTIYYLPLFMPYL